VVIGGMTARFACRLVSPGRMDRNGRLGRYRWQDRKTDSRSSRLVARRLMLSPTRRNRRAISWWPKTKSFSRGPRSRSSWGSGCLRRGAARVSTIHPCCGPIKLTMGLDVDGERENGPDPGDAPDPGEAGESS
jgi:hypothetical protein